MLGGGDFPRAPDKAPDYQNRTPRRSARAGAIPSPGRDSWRLRLPVAGAFFTPWDKGSDYHGYHALAMAPPANAKPSLDDVLAKLQELTARRGVDRIWDIAIKSLIPIVMVVVGWGIILEVRVSVIESNRFTSKDAAELRNSLLRDLPPTWLREDLKEIKDRLRRLEERKEPK